jgi:polysaccharide biosynthesis/export protein
MAQNCAQTPARAQEQKAIATAVSQQALAPQQPPGCPSARVKLLLALALGALLAVGCATAPSHLNALPERPANTSSVMQINSALASAALQAPEPSSNYRIGAEDLLEVTLYNIAETDTKLLPRKAELRINQEGQISLPLLGDITVGGLTVTALEQVLRDRLSEYVHNPLVGVQVKEYRSQHISVMGAVRSPGVFQLTGPKTLVDLLAMAGGIHERAGSQVHLYRDQHDGRQTYLVDLLRLANNPSLVNMPVQSGDVINVPESGMFFVDGSVAKPGSYPLNRPYTLTQALAIAGGVTARLADYSGVVVFRRQGSPEAARIAINLKEVLAGETADPQVEADDVIIVPISTAKYFVERFIGTIGLPGVPMP